MIKISTKLETKITDKNETEMPRKHVIQNILNYSKSLQINDSKLVNKVEFLLS